MRGMTTQHFFWKILRTFHNPPPMSERTERLLQRLQQWCEAQRGRQSVVATYLDIDRQIVNEWVKRKRKPTSEQTLALIEFLDIQEGIEPGDRDAGSDP